MDLSNLRDYLLVGSYLTSAAGWWILYRELRYLRNETVRVREALSYEQGLRNGEDHEARLTRLERQPEL